ncbi:hypothetical protein DFH09DRAFT_1466227 [Mycena vulgaris]|nr:hypothetical protein DFH09DRAFT_1466227 [Mycena vulgaris]
MHDVVWEENNAGVNYSSGNWSRQYGSIYHGSTVMRTSQLGDSMSVAFNGSAIKFMGAQGWDHGSFLVNLDGEEVTVDGYCCGPNGGVPQTIQFEASGLVPGAHILNITNSASGPHGSVLEVDAIIIPQHGPNYRYLALLALLILLAPILVAVHRRRRRLAKGTPHHVLLITSQVASNPSRTPVLSSQQHPSPRAGGTNSIQKILPPPAVALPLADDELVERIAQRAASLVRADALPTYKKDTTT